MSALLAVFVPELPEKKRSLALILSLRALFLLIALYAVDNVIILGTSSAFLSLSIIVGVLLASYLAFTKLRSLGFFVFCILALVLYRSAIKFLDFLPFQGQESIFFVTHLNHHMSLGLLVAGIAMVSTWCFWRFRHALTLEIILMAACAIALFSAHRDYRFDMVKFVTKLAWYFGIGQLSMLVILGALVGLFIITYMYVATLPGKPEQKTLAGSVLLHGSRPRALAGTLVAMFIMLLIYVVSVGTYYAHLHALDTRIKNGVGDETKEGLSPLDFHQSLGGSNQPAAVVRMEGDYAENPFSPMLYLREAALSDLIEHKYVRASKVFDKDVSHSHPREYYKTEGDPRLSTRVPLVQSIYLLGKHKLAFAVDYPLSLIGLQLPNDKKHNRFVAAYRAYSMAPTYNLEDIRKDGIGDPEWTPEIWSHYLETHSDLRYAELAAKVTKEVASPIEKSFAVIDFLSRASTYTLTPGHEVGEFEDPTAAYLFGDMRGYCVHFAHATVHMLRSLGIPSRVGTGYLTNLSQSKDGHILLRMSDRHAWAEVYITDRGWVPFDTQPDNVENHAETPVDMKLLEELMGMLDSGVEMLPDDIAAEEPGMDDPSDFVLPDPQHLAFPIIFVVLLLLTAKGLLLFGWIFPANPTSRLQRSYRAILAFLYDAGIQRNEGETRTEFQQRLARDFDLELLHPATGYLNSLKYASDGGRIPSKAEILRSVRGDSKEIRKLPFFKRILSLLNPASLLAAFRKEI